MRGCPLIYPSPHSRGELAFSRNPKFRDSSEAPSNTRPATPADGAKPLCQVTQDEPRVCLASSLWLHPEGVVWALPSWHKPGSAPTCSAHWLVHHLGLPSAWRAHLPHTHFHSETGRSGHACPASAPRNTSSVLSSPAPSCLLLCRPAWYDLPPPPYSSDTESLNQADLPPYRSRSGSADSASSQAASSLLSVDGTSHSPGQPGPPEGTAEPRGSVPSQGTEEV